MMNHQDSLCIYSSMHSNIYDSAYIAEILEKYIYYFFI